MKMVWFCFIAWLGLACNSKKAISTDAGSQIPDCMKQEIAGLGKHNWFKVVKINEQPAEQVKAENWQQELSWLNYLQLPEKEKDQYRILPSSTILSGQSWIRNNNDNGLQTLYLRSSIVGKCEQAKALVKEKNVLFERRLKLNASFKSDDTLAIFTVSGYQKVLFSEPVNYEVIYYALQP